MVQNGGSNKTINDFLSAIKSTCSISTKRQISACLSKFCRCSNKEPSQQNTLTQTAVNKKRGEKKKRKEKRKEKKAGQGRITEFCWSWWGDWKRRSYFSLLPLFCFCFLSSFFIFYFYKERVTGIIMHRGVGWRLPGMQQTSLLKFCYNTAGIQQEELGGGGGGGGEDKGQGQKFQVC